MWSIFLVLCIRNHPAHFIDKGENDYLRRSTLKIILFRKIQMLSINLILNLVLIYDITLNE